MTDPEDMAYPQEIKIFGVGGELLATKNYTGVTKREYLVGQLLEGAANYYGTVDEMRMIVKRAVKMANMAVDELNKP